MTSLRVPVALCLGHVLGEVESGAVEGSVTRLDSHHGKGGGDMALTCSGRSDEEQPTMFSHETSSGQVLVK